MRRQAIVLLLLALPVWAQGHGHQRSFADIEKWIERFEDPDRDEWQKPDLVVDLLGLQPGNNVADVGAGTGYFTRRMARRIVPGGLAVAADIEPGFFPYVARRAVEEMQDNIFTQQALANNPRLAAATYDLVFICNTIHHIEHRAEYYAWLKRALRTRGRVVIVDFFKDMEIPVGPEPAMRIAPGTLRAELQAAGFTVSVDAETLPYQYILIATALD